MLSEKDLSAFNPWWRSPKSIDEDPSIVELGASPLQWVPELRHSFEDLDVIYGLRGPRRVGKTTLIKTMIRDLLAGGIDPLCILFLPCDLLGTPRALFDAVAFYLDRVKADRPCRSHIFIDEVSMIRGWQRAIKALSDAGRLKNCTMLLTGSHSIDLRKATETLAGRRGEVSRLTQGGPDKTLLPMLFAEYASARSNVMSRALREAGLAAREGKRNALAALLGGTIPEGVKRMSLCAADLEALLDDYLITGGMPLPVREHMGSRTISPNTYAGYMGLLMRDLSRWGADEAYARQLLERVVATMTSHVSWNSLKEGTEIRDHKTVESYVMALRDGFVLNCLYRLHAKGRPWLLKEKKLYFMDPFIFHACRGWLSGRDPYQGCLEFLADAESKGRLVESTVGSHLLRIAGRSVHTQLGGMPGLFYWRSKKSGREVDFVLRGCEGEGAPASAMAGGSGGSKSGAERYATMEVKYSGQVKKEDAYGIYDFMKGGAACRSGIVVSKDVLDARSNYVAVPAYLFLLLA